MLPSSCRDLLVLLLGEVNVYLNGNVLVLLDQGGPGLPEALPEGAPAVKTPPGAGAPPEDVLAPAGRHLAEAAAGCETRAGAACQVATTGAVHPSPESADHRETAAGTDGKPPAGAAAGGSRGSDTWQPLAGEAEQDAGVQAAKCREQAAGHPGEAVAVPVPSPVVAPVFLQQRKIVHLVRHGHTSPSSSGSLPPGGISRDTRFDVPLSHLGLQQVVGKEFPWADVGHLADVWWHSPLHAPNDAVAGIFGSRESLPQLRRRVGEFRRYLRALPEQTLVVIGHSTFFKELVGTNRRMAHCEVLTVRI
eukprot:jgi/Mesen1/8527/ME000480S07883